MKKVLSLVLALVMVLGSFSMVSAAPYSDVAGTTVESAVDRLSLLGILEGYPDGSFKPEGSITRAEFAAVAVRAKGLEAVAQAAKGLPTGFKDVAATSWMSGYVGTAGKLGIVNGVGNGMFAPEAPVKYEEAVTMIVRALGYEAAAQARGGYPYGYLIVANEAGLLDAVKGTQGVAATRGLVAQLTDNALETPMMVQVGFGSEAKFVVSGSKEHGGDEIYLLDEMGFDTYEGRVTSVNTKKNTITLDNEDADLKLKDLTVKVAKEFDFYSVEGLTIKAWYNNDTVVLYTVKDEAKFDAVTGAKDEMTLVTEDEDYDVARGAVLVLDGNKVDAKDFAADYAKVVLNEDDEIVWAEGYKFGGFIVNEEVKDDKIMGYNNDELKVKDFTIVKDGKTVELADLEDGDIVFYNVAEKFAVVSNNAKEGKLDRVYTSGATAFRFEGSAYSLSTLGSLYFDEGKTGTLNSAILADFLDDEATITVFVDFAGKVVLVSGEVSSVGNSAYGVLIANPASYSGRKGAMIGLDLRNGANEKVYYDIAANDIPSNVKLTGTLSNANELRALVAGKVVKVTVDKDGDVIGIDHSGEITGADLFKTKDANVKVGAISYRLQSNTLVFYNGNKKVTTLENAKDLFTEVKAGSTIYVDKGYVVAVVGETNTDKDTKNVTGLVTGVTTVAGGKLQFTVKVFGVTQRLLTESKTLVEANFAEYKDNIKTFEVGETSGEIKGFPAALPGFKTLTINTISGRTINDVELNNNAVIYDNKLAAVNVRDLKPGMTITVYFEGSSNRFVDYVMAGAVNVVTPEASGVVTYIIDAAGTESAVIEIDGKTTYVVNANTSIKYNGNTIALGKTAVNAAIKTGSTTVAITEGDRVKVDGDIITILESAKLTADAAALQLLVDAVKTAAGTTVDAAKAGATGTALNALSLTGYTSANNAAYQAAIAVKAVADVNTVAKLQAIVTTVNAEVDAAALQLLVDAVKTAAGTTVDPAKAGATGTALNALSLTGYASANNAAYQAAIAVKAVADVNTVAKLQAIVTTVNAEVVQLGLETSALSAVNSAANGPALMLVLDTHEDTLGLTQYKALSGGQKLITANYVFSVKPGGGYTKATLIAAIAAAQ